MSNDAHTDTAEHTPHEDGLEAGQAAAAASAGAGGAYAATRALHEEHTEDAGADDTSDAAADPRLGRHRRHGRGRAPVGAGRRPLPRRGVAARRVGRPAPGRACRDDHRRPRGVRRDRAAHGVRAGRPGAARGRRHRRRHHRGRDARTSRRPSDDSAEPETSGRGDEHAPSTRPPSTLRPRPAPRSRRPTTPTAARPTWRRRAPRSVTTRPRPATGPPTRASCSRRPTTAATASRPSGPTWPRRATTRRPPTRTAPRRPTTRRDAPASDDATDAPASDDATDAPASDESGSTATEGRRISGFEELRDGGFGVGSAAPLDDGAQPLDHPVRPTATR